MKTILMLSSAMAVLACAGISCTPSGNAGNENNVKSSELVADGDDARANDEKFVKEAADGGMFEERLGKYVMDHASTATAKQLGQQMYNDHGKANKELQELARKKGISLDAEMSTKKQDDYEKVAKNTGIDLDKTYAEQMVKDHKKDIDAFQDEADKGKDADIKAWAAGKVEVLKHHLMMAENARDELKEKE